MTRGRLRTCALVLLVALPCLAGALGPAAAAAPTPAPSSAVPAPGDPTGGPATVALSSLSPQVARPGTDVVVTGVVTAAEPLEDVTVRVWVRRSVTVRAQLQNAVESTSPEGTPGTLVDVSASLAAGASHRFRVVLPAAAVSGGPDVGVRVLSLDVRADDPDGGTRRVALDKTFLPWVPAANEERATKLAVVWPLHDEPHRTADDVFVDDSLAREVAADGRLRTLLDASQGWTLALDPMLAEDLAEMARPTGYLVATATGSTRRPRSAAAADVLAALRARAAQPGAVTLLPYGDVDVAALVAARREADLKAAVARARAVASTVLGASLAVRVGLPQGEGWTARQVAALDRAGVHTVVLPGSWVPADPDASSTPSARTDVRLGDGVSSPALLSDTALTGLLTGTSRRADALARFLAETAMHTAELPGRPRALVVVLPRDWVPVSAGYARALHATLAAADWVVPSSLAPLAAEPATDEREADVPSGTVSASLSRSYLTSVAAHATAGTQFSTVLATTKRATALAAAYAAERLRLESVVATQDGATLLDRSERALRAREAQVRVVTNGHITVPGGSSFPLTVRNDLDQDVRVAVAFSKSGRVSVQTTKVVRVPAGKATRVSVQTRASANGPADITMQLITPRGKLFGDAQPLRLRVRGAGGPAKAVVALAGVVFLFAAGARIVRRRRPGTDSPHPEGTSPA
ncbi:hypothetical protein CLV35_0808 [Motilibacter peucedani]|uniref:Uncharacterized protein n=1 Tax=Motilibacter peucedani TaxID=598650 RepID=A0A420XUE0_9ACTN|nr:DUF6049 family protein [Motilibacter peucedani]RKS80377.1 hypothetical protein CLV35_0808 [Motilibacter peucedani]